MRITDSAIMTGISMRRYDAAVDYLADVRALAGNVDDL